jgi:surface polysaccharide O-acyltransferase-like enzyme
MSFRPDVHMFRGVAITGIVVGHFVDNFTWQDHSLLRGVLFSLVDESSIWFVFIAGFLFQHLSARYKTSSYLQNKWKNVIIPYLLWSIPAMTFVIWTVDKDIPPEFYSFGLVTQIGLLLVTGFHLGPLWFVPTIAVFYLLAPLLIKLDRTGRLIWVLIPLLLVSVVIGRDGLVNHGILSPWLRTLDHVIYLLSPYIFGMICSRHYDLIISVLRKHWPKVVATTTVLFAISVFMPKAWDGWISIHFVFKTFACLTMLYALNLYHKKLWQGFNVLADYSFGIFFLHGFIAAAHRMLMPPLDGNLIVLSLAVAITLGLCVGFLYTVRRVAGTRSRSLVGC